jgi:hypothetical protein
MMPAALVYALMKDDERAALNRAHASRRASRERARAERRARRGAARWLS